MIHIWVRIDGAVAVVSDIHSEFTHDLAVRETIVSAVRGLLVLQVEEVGLVNISRGEFSSLDVVDTVEETTSLPDSGDESRADHRGTIGIDPRILFRHGEDLANSKVTLEHDFVSINEVEVGCVESLVDGFSNETVRD